MFTTLICHCSVTSAYFEAPEDISIPIHADLSNIASASTLVIFHSGLKLLLAVETILLSAAISTARHIQLFGFEIETSTNIFLHV